MPRFVLLLHSLPDGTSHYDLMLERGGSLATWRLPVPLDRIPSAGVDAEALGDHRIHYLTHEGDIGGGRGSVRRVDDGTYDSETWDPGKLVRARVRGRTAAGRLEIAAGPNAATWTVRLVTAS